MKKIGLILAVAFGMLEFNVSAASIFDQENIELNIPSSSLVKSAERGKCHKRHRKHHRIGGSSSNSGSDSSGSTDIIENIKKR